MQSCPRCGSKSFHRKGHYYVKVLKTYRRRYLCTSCKKSYSSQTNHCTYQQKRPDLNEWIDDLLSNGMSQRGAARILRCSKNTVAAKFLWLAENAKIPNEIKGPKVLFIDEMESIEHTKLKPLTIPLAVTDKYEIIGTTVGRIPAKGKLSKISVKKYGRRANERPIALRKLFQSLKSKLQGSPEIVVTDAAPIYVGLAKKYFPAAKHEVYIARELHKKKREMVYLSKKKPFNPLFPLDQRCAKLRSDIRRLTRRSWCTTKKVENLEKMLKLYEASQYRH